MYDAMLRFWYYRFKNIENSHSAQRTYLKNVSLASIALAGRASGTVFSIIPQPARMVKTKQPIHNMKFTEFIRHSRTKNILWRLGRIFSPRRRIEVFIFLSSYEALKRKYTKDNEGYTSLTIRMGSKHGGIWHCWLAFDLPERCDPQSTLCCCRPNTIMNGPDMIRNIYAEKGRRTVHSGFVVTLLRAGPVAAFVSPIFDIIIENLNKSTG